MKRPPLPLPQRIRVKRTRRLAGCSGAGVPGGEGIVFSVQGRIDHDARANCGWPPAGIPDSFTYRWSVGVPEMNVTLPELTDAVQIAAARDLQELFSQASHRADRRNRNAAAPIHTRTEP